MKLSKVRPLLVLLAAGVSLFANLPVVAQDRISTLTLPEQVIVENKHMTVREGFGAQFWITDSDRFFLNWVRSDTKNLTPISFIRRNVPLFIAIFIVDPGVKKTVIAEGKPKLSSDVTYDFEILRPDGTPYPGGGGLNITGWRGRPPAEHLVTLLYDNHVTLNFDLVDPVGEYTIRVLVHDNVKNVTVPLTRTVMLHD